MDDQGVGGTFYDFFHGGGRGNKDPHEHRKKGWQNIENSEYL